MYNILVGGAAGDGIDTIVSVFEKTLKKAGYSVFTTRDFMSRVRGGHNFTQVRFGDKPLFSHRNTLDGIIALNDETVALHRERLNEKGFILCDTGVKTDDPRALKIDMEETAKALGNAKASGSVAIGAALKLFGEDLRFAQDVMKADMKPSILEVNLTAIEAGFGLAEKRHEHIDAGFADNMLINGNGCISLGAIAGGLRFYSAYPMSPSTSIMTDLASYMEKAEILVEQGEDEIGVINMALGASYAGARSMVGTSGGGFSLMVEALGFSGIAEIPVVIADIQRPGPATGFPTRTEQADLKFAVSASQGEFPRMVIAVRHHADGFHQTARALDIAERYRMPVILLSDQYLADSSATIPLLETGDLPEPVTETQPDGEEYRPYRLTENGISPRRIPGKSSAVVAVDSDEHDEYGHITESAEIRVQMVDKRAKKLETLRHELQEPDFLGEEGCRTLLVGFGSTYGPIREALEILKESDPGEYGALIFGDVHPLPIKEIEKYAKQTERIVNVEQNATGQFASILREATGIVCDGSILKYDGRQIRGEEVAERVRAIAKQGGKDNGQS